MLSVVSNNFTSSFPKIYDFFKNLTFLTYISSIVLSNTDDWEVFLLLILLIMLLVLSY